ncbi:ATP-grasp domain-containing protein [Phytobacter diazotrophicus]|uniref:ATP-grasp domain-containing protein n=1 Tax=Phytobacter diazotrophicus TaxID=395631 RepID=UPI001451220F|nr:ATP-grasp domain-containing protein [Phytobacter diazotrophicus]QJF17179.1 ATP-grasp domain-containing protein [Phytobacter diazotrophicus]
MINVLISPAGTEIGREIWLSLRYEKTVKLFLAGSDYDNHARYNDEQYHILPNVNEDGWLEALQAFVLLYDIHFIFPAHDDALLAYAQHQPEISAKVVSSNTKCCEITRYKSRTYDKLRDIVPVPRCYKSAEEVENWPVFIKPDRGQGAQGALKVNDKSTLEIQLRDNSDLLICEYLPGSEYTVDCFTRENHGVVFCQPRTRERIRAGISMASETIELPGILEMAQAISERLQLKGAWFFQVKLATNGTLTLLEVAPRIAGTMAVNRVRGVNFALLSLYEHQNLPVTIDALKPTNRISRALTNRFRCDLPFGHVYVDFDDTLIIHNKLCLPLVHFLYQCVNEGIPCYLISRHDGDLHEKLKRWRIESLFDEVIHLRQEEEKSRFIKHADAIFIDDSFRERHEVHCALGINTFDVSMLDLLLKE